MLDFDWSNYKNWETPLVPFISQESENDLNSLSREASDDKDGENTSLSLSQVLNEQNGKKLVRARTSDNVDLGAFQMRRLDVLDKLNQEAFLNIQRYNQIRLSLIL